jgi:hypothetical protein
MDILKIIKEELLLGEKKKKYNIQESMNLLHGGAYINIDDDEKEFVEQYLEPGKLELHGYELYYDEEDEDIMAIMKDLFPDIVNEGKKKKDPNPCWKGYEMVGMKMKGGKEVPNCVPMKEEEMIQEAEYQGKKVTLNKPTRCRKNEEGCSKKFKVFVQDRDGVKKVQFGDPNMEIKRDNPKNRKSFRARHNCDNPGPKTKARYWSCKKW